ncbi:MAG: alpha/beta hydrolase, partial [Planctomycetia bacterium]
MTTFWNTPGMVAAGVGRWQGNRWAKAAAVWTVALLLSGCAAHVALRLLETNLLYHPTPAAEEFLPPPSPSVQDVELRTKNGDPVHAWWRPVDESKAPAEKLAVLYLHGNAGNLSHRGDSIDEWTRATGWPVFIVDYPGFGKSGGAPSEQGCVEAGEASLEWLAAHGYPADRVLLFGASLGGGVAVELAVRHPDARALVVMKSFTSIP